MAIEKPNKSVIKNNVVKDMIGANASKGKGKDGMRQMSYYLTDDLIKALAYKSVKTGKDRSFLVREALEEYLKSELDKLDDF